MTRDELRELRARAISLFKAIKHGDQEHRDWLEKAITDYFAGRPVERPRGSGSGEARGFARGIEAAMEAIEGSFLPISYRRLAKSAIEALQDREKPHDH